MSTDESSSSFFSWHIEFMSFLGCQALCIVIIFLFFCPPVWIILLSILRMVQIILQEGLSRYLFLWWDFCCKVVFFFEKFSCSFEVLLLFLFSLLVWWCPLLILSCISSFPISSSVLIFSGLGNSILSVVSMNSFWCSCSYFNPKFHGPVCWGCRTVSLQSKILSTSILNMTLMVKL